MMIGHRERRQSPSNLPTRRRLDPGLNSLLFVLLLSTTFFSISVAFSSSSIHARSAVAAGFRTPLIPCIMYERKNDEKGYETGTEKGDKSTYYRKKRPLLRLLDNLWYVMTVPFPDLRKLTRKRERESDFVISLRLQDGLAALIAYLGVGVFAYHVIFEKWSIVDSLYFTCVCFSTVGYGDLSPQTRGGKLFTCLFGLTGIALLGAVVATIGSRLAQAEVEAVKLARKESQKRLTQIYDRMPKVVTSLRRASNKEQKKVMKQAREHLAFIPLPHFTRGVATLWKALRWVVQSLSVVAAGGLVLGKIEGWNLYDSLYYSLITASTIGLGDFAPTTRAGRIASVIFIPIAVASIGEILAGVGMALVERRQKKIFQMQLKKGLTMDHLKAMDANRDGKVEREEYVLFMLMEMGLVSKHEIEELWEQFDRLDVTCSGYLDRDDLLLMAKLRDEGLID